MLLSNLALSETPVLKILNYSTQQNDCISHPAPLGEVG